MNMIKRVAIVGGVVALAIVAVSTWQGRATQERARSDGAIAQMRSSNEDTRRIVDPAASADPQTADERAARPLSETTKPITAQKQATTNAAFAAMPPMARMLQTKIGPVPAQMANGRRIELVNGYPALSNRVLVRYRENASASEQSRVATLADAIDVRVLADPRDRLYAIDTGGEASVAERVHRLAKDPAVLYVEPDYVVRALAIPNDPGFGNLWGLRNIGQTIRGVIGTSGVDIGATNAWDISKGSASIAVGVVDTGVDYNAPDLVPNMWSAPTAFTVNIGGKVLNCPAGTHGLHANTYTGFHLGITCDPMDDFAMSSCSLGNCFYGKHGTHVAGTIGARGNNAVGMTGINWISSIVALKFLDSSGSGIVSDAFTVLDGAIQLKQQGLANIRVLNNSWGGGGTSQAMVDMINKLNTNGILFVSAAGNSNSDNDSTPVVPGSIVAANTINVVATDNRDVRASFSNYGKTTSHLGAPGVGIYSTVNNVVAYEYYDGTSMATPHVAGAAALLMAACPGLNVAGVKSALLNNVDKIAAMSTTTITGGRLNLRKAIASCSGPFSVSGEPSVRNIGTGKSTTYTVAVGRNGGFSGTVNLSVSGLPTGATASFSPVSFAGTATGSSILTVATATTTPLGNYTLTVKGTSGTTVVSSSVVLQVAAPNFALTASPASRLLKPGQSGSYTVSASSVGSFVGTIGLSASGLPAGVTARFSPTSIAGGAGNSTLTLTVGSTTADGLYTITINGVGGGLTRSTTAQLEVRRPTFALGGINPTVTVTRKTFTVPVFVQAEVTPAYGFVGTVNITATGAPGGTVTLTPVSITNPDQRWASFSSTNLMITPTTPLGTYTVTFTATGAGVAKTVRQTLIVN